MDKKKSNFETKLLSGFKPNEIETTVNKKSEMNKAVPYGPANNTRTNFCPKILMALIISFICINVTWGQNISKTSKSQTRQSYSALLDSAQHFLPLDANQSILYVEGALRELNRSKRRDQSAVSQAYFLLGDIYFHWKAYDLAISNYQKAMETDPSKYRRLDGYSIRVQMARSYLLSNQYNKSKSLILDLQKQRGLLAYQQIELWEILGDIWKGLSRQKEALDAYNKALKTAQKAALNDKIIALNSKIGEVYSQEGDFYNAERNLQNSIQIAQQQSVQQEVTQNEKLADLYRGNNQFDKEIQIRKNSLDQIEKLPAKKIDSLSSQSINYDIADAYVEQKRYNEAIPYLNKSIQVAAESRDLETEKNAVQRLSEVYKQVGDYDNSLLNYQKYVTLVDLLYAKKEQEIKAASSFTKTLALKQNRIDILEKDRELSENQLKRIESERELIKERNRKQELLIYFLLGGLSLLFLVVYLMYRSNQQKKLANNLLALKSLRSQMNPHFIFNALNSVNSFIAKNDERTANKYLTDFSTLMRTVLEHSEKDFIPLSREIELIQLYLTLEHARFKEKFDYHFDLAENIDLDHFEIPPMLIQPYIENAVWHGLRYKKGKGQLTITIHQKDANNLVITIADNGIGRTKSKALKTKNQLKQTSKGMGNISSRIAILNEMYAGKISVQVNDLQEDGGGTVVILEIKK